jgi:PilZ domain
LGCFYPEVKSLEIKNRQNLPSLQEELMSEHRKEERKKLTSFMLVYALPENILLGYLGDMTLRGAMVVGNRPVEPNKELTLFIEFNEIPEVPTGQLTFATRVAWCKHEAQSPYYNTGVEFLELSDQNKKVLEVVLERYQFSQNLPA